MSEESIAVSSFQSLGITDTRLLRALDRIQHAQPTATQIQVIPRILHGGPILIRAQTGSGKTAAYCLPVLQKILQKNSKNAFQAMNLVPTRELAAQVTRQIKEYVAYAKSVISVCNLATGDPIDHQSSLLAQNPIIIIATPASIRPHLRSQQMNLRESLQSLVLDEADLLLSFGYQDDLMELVSHIPPLCQVIVASATLPEQLDSLQDVLFQNAQLIDLSEQERKQPLNLTQLVTKVDSDDDRFLLAYVLFKLQLLPSPTLVFVNSGDRAYRLKLFLEQFAVKSVVVNGELPVRSRWHAVEEFNRGLYKIVIASDQGNMIGETDEGDEHEALENINVDNDDDEQVEEVDAESSSLQNNKKRKRTAKEKKDKEYGTARGVDFKNVKTVVNFDFPQTSKAYTHRVGRTARNRAAGVALSFVLAPSKDKFVRVNKISGENEGKHDQRVLAKVERDQNELGRTISPFKFDDEQVEPFRYRMEDALRAVTRISIRNARIKEIKRELLYEEKLQSQLANRPQDLEFLRHDLEARTSRLQEHLKMVPEYLKPKGLKKVKMPKTTGAVLADLNFKQKDKRSFKNTKVRFNFN